MSGREREGCGKVLSRVQQWLNDYNRRRDACSVWCEAKLILDEREATRRED